MAVGNFMSIHSNEGVRRTAGLPQEETQPVRHAVATFLSFGAAGILPLLPYVTPVAPHLRFSVAIVLTLAALFGLGVFRAIVTSESWLVNGLLMLALGSAVAVVAYAAGLVIAAAGG